MYLPLSKYICTKSFRLRCANLAVDRIRKVAFSKGHIGKNNAGHNYKNALNVIWRFKLNIFARIVQSKIKTNAI